MKISFGAGLNENQYPSLHEAYIASQNFDLFKDASHLSPRKSFDLEGTATNAGDIRGFLQLVKRDGTETTLIQAANTVYQWDGASTFTVVGSCGATSQLRDAYWALDNYIVIADLQKLSVVQKWDGTTLSTLTTGLGVDFYAKYVIVHQGRVWFFNVTTSTDTPHLIVASEFETPTSYDTTKRVLDQSFTSGDEAFYMLSPDLRPINGVALFHGDMVISTVEGHLYKLTGVDSTTYAWEDFYAGSAAVGDESIVNTGNDVMYMRRGGSIESLRTTQEYGDTAADDLSRWIPQTVKNLTTAIAIYDQQNQKVLFFVYGKVLVLFKDILFGGAVIDDQGTKQKLSPWSVYVTTDSGQFNCAAAKYMREPGTSNFNVFFGASDGRIFKLNGTSDGDAGSANIRVVRTLRFFGKEDAKINFSAHITRGLIQYRRLADLDFNITLDWGDEYNQSTATIPLKGAPADDVGVFYGGDVYYGGDFYYNSGFEFASKIAHQNASWVGKGSGCSVVMTTLDTQQYQVDNIELM